MNKAHLESLPYSDLNGIKYTFNYKGLSCEYIALQGAIGFLILTFIKPNLKILA